MTRFISKAVQRNRQRRLSSLKRPSPHASRTPHASSNTTIVETRPLQAIRETITLTSQTIPRNAWFLGDDRGTPVGRRDGARKRRRDECCDEGDDESDRLREAHGNVEDGY